MMGPLLACSLKSAVCLALFYMCYKAIVSGETFHRSNRIMLLVMIGLAVVIPFLAILPMRHMADAHLPMIMGTGGIGIEIADNADHESNPWHQWFVYALFIYIAGIAGCLLRNIVGIIRILRLIRKGKQTRIDRIRMIVHDDHRIAPFSWFNYIVVSQTDLNEAGETILTHEQAHIRHYHTLDLCLAELCILFQWYNPAAWLLHRELKTIHEYEADESVIKQGIEAKQYQLLLIKKAVGSRLYSMANSFNHSNLKKRITMMLQKKSNTWARLKYAYILPLAAFAVVAFARTEIAQPFEEISSVKVSDLTVISNPAEVKNRPDEMLRTVEAIPATIDRMETERHIADRPVQAINETTQISFEDTTVFTVVETQPEFPGGQSALMEFIVKNLKYPEVMQQSGIQGRIIASFIVARDGTVRNPIIVRGLCPEGDAEAIRLIKSMPNWTPGKQKGKAVNVKYTIPLQFKLQN